MEKWYYFPIQTTQNIKIKMPRRLILHGLGSAWLPRRTDSTDLQVWDTPGIQYTFDSGRLTAAIVGTEAVEGNSNTSQTSGLAGGRCRHRAYFASAC